MSNRGRPCMQTVDSQTMGGGGGGRWKVQAEWGCRWGRGGGGGGGEVGGGGGGGGWGGGGGLGGGGGGGGDWHADV